ncbi:MAG: ABC transporter permease [Burkholderiales bacterium]
MAVLLLFSFQAGRFPIPPFDGPSLHWYAVVFADGKLVAALANSLLVALLSSAAACLLGFTAAYGLARHKLPAAGLQRALITAPLTVSYLIIGLGLLIAFNILGVPRSLLTVGIGHAVINTPLCFAIIYSQMGDQQANAERAARDLGAAEWQVLALITAPMLWPTLLAAYFIAFTLSWDEFVIAFLLSRFDVTLPVVIWGLLRSGLSPELNAAGTLVFAISIAIVLAVELLLWRGRKAAANG